MLIDQLPEITTANDADEMPIEQGTTTRKIKILNLLKGVVKKAGDTMTGNLTFDAGKSLHIKANYQSNGAYTSNQWGYQIQLDDSVGANIAMVRTGHYANGIEVTEHFARRNVNGSDVYNALQLRIASDGTRSVGVTDPAPWREALGAMSQAGTDISGTDTTSASGDYAGAIKTILTSNAPQSWAKGMYCGAFRKTNSGTQTAWTGMYLLNVFNPNANWSTQGLVVAQGYIFSIWYKSGAWGVLKFALD